MKEIIKKTEIKMKYRINQFFNINALQWEKWYISIKSERNKRYHILMNGSVPHIFDTKDEAKIYLDSVKDDIEWLIKNEPKVFSKSICRKHKPMSKKLSYLGHVTLMERKIKQGHKQHQCPKCGRWLFKCEM